ncbi:hypothetical protein Tco_0291927 [Tanacetum coccineum]
MVEQQTIKYAPQWTNMTMDNVIFQTNNVVGNFNYPPNVPAYKPIMKFLQNCPLYNAFTNCPSMVYQNFLREFWSTAITFDPFPTTDEPEKRPLKEFLIKFLVLNGQRHLNLDFHIFCSSTGLNYHNGKYVDHPTPKVVKKELFNIAINPSYLDKTPVLKNWFPMAWRILFTFVFQRDSVSPPPLAAKLKKGKSQTVASTLPKSQGPGALGALSKKSKRPKSKKPPTKTKRDIQLASTGLPSTLDEGTRQSKPLPESTTTHPKDSRGNKQPLDRDITSMTPDEGTNKTTPRPKGLLGDKDSWGNLPPADMEPIHTPVADPSRTGAKYQTFVDIQAYLLSEDELDKDSDEEEMLAAGDDMDEDIQANEEVRTPSPKQDDVFQKH